MSMTNHGGSSRVLVHAVDNKTNGHGQQNHTIQLTVGIVVLGKGQNGNTRASQNDTEMHPGQKGSLVGKKDFGFNLNGSLAQFH